MLRQYKAALTGGAFVVSGLGLWTYMYTRNTRSQRNNNTLMKAINSHLRLSPTIKELLGDGVHRSDNVVGDVNVIKGHAEMVFGVKGDSGEGLVRYKGVKMNQFGQWRSEVFEIQMLDGQTVNLAV